MFDGLYQGTLLYLAHQIPCTIYGSRTIRNTKVSGYLCFTLSTGFKEMNSLLLEFFRVGRLCFAHRTLLVLAYHISLLRPPIFGAIPSSASWSTWTHAIARLRPPSNCGTLLPVWEAISTVPAMIPLDGRPYGKDGCASCTPW